MREDWDAWISKICKSGRQKSEKAKPGGIKKIKGCESDSQPLFSPVSVCSSTADTSALALFYKNIFQIFHDIWCTGTVPVQTDVPVGSGIVNIH